MKKLFTMIAMFVVALSAQAQHEEGDLTIQPRVGVTISNLTDGDKWKTNLAYGVEFERFFTDEFSVAGGVFFTNQGSIYNPVEKSDEDIKLNVYYGALPFTANYYILPGLALKAGIQPAFRVKAKIQQGKTKLDLDNALDILFEGTGNKVNTFDLSIPVGFSYELHRITLDARYNIGVTKLISGSETVRNSVFVLTLGYKFGG